MWNRSGKVSPRNAFDVFWPGRTYLTDSGYSDSRYEVCIRNLGRSIADLQINALVQVGRGGEDIAWLSGNGKVHRKTRLTPSDDVDATI